MIAFDLKDPESKPRIIAQLWKYASETNLDFKAGAEDVYERLIKGGSVLICGAHNLCENDGQDIIASTIMLCVARDKEDGKSSDIKAFVLRGGVEGHLFHDEDFKEAKIRGKYIDMRQDARNGRVEVLYRGMQSALDDLLYYSNSPDPTV